MKMLSYLAYLKQLFSKPVTNLFPAKYAPKSVLALLDAVGKGKAKLNSPVEVPAGFRGKLVYEKDKCIGCFSCTRVCPSKAIVPHPTEARKVIHYAARCTFCSQCVDVCPVKCLHMSDEFLLADTNKFSDNLIVGK